LKRYGSWLGTAEDHRKGKAQRYETRSSKTRSKRWAKSQARTVLKLDSAGKRKRVQGCHKYAVFKVFGTDFVLCLVLGSFLEDPVLAFSGDLRVSIYGNDTEFRSRKLSSMFLQLAEGHLMGQELSSVRGYVWRDKFYGSVWTDKFVLQIEPLPRSGPVITRYSSFSNRMLNAYVYRVFMKSTKKKKHDKSRREKTTFAAEYTHSSYLENNQVYKPRKNIEPSYKKSSRFDWSRTRRATFPGQRLNESCRSCGLLLIADHSFFIEVGEGAVKQTVLQMLYHVRESNLILRNQDYNRDGRPDCVGIHVAGVGVITSQHFQDNLLSGQFTSPEEYLKAFSRYQFDGYCLAVLFSSRILGRQVLGLSWQGDPARGAGVCQTRRNVHSKGIKEYFNLNSLFITLRTRRKARIPLRMGVLNLAHEILHSFGAHHDNSSCIPKDVKGGGRFLMSRYSGTGLHTNNELVSNCTAETVSASLSSPDQTYCLHQSTPGFCGDGVVDDGEECDCGGVVACIKGRSCCTPPGLRRGETECNWRKSIKACKFKTELTEREFELVNLDSRHEAEQPANHRRRSRASRRHRRKRRVRRRSLCPTLGLKKCRCSDGCYCCQTESGTCIPDSTLLANFFTIVQRWMANCTGRVLTCLTQSGYTYRYDVSTNSLVAPLSSTQTWMKILKKLSKLKPDKQGTVFCLRSSLDSNCWQLNLDCSPRGRRTSLP